MASGALDYEIQKYLPLLGNEEKQALLGVIRTFISLKKGATDGLDVDQYNKEIEDAMALIKKGKYTSQDDLL